MPRYRPLARLVGTAVAAAVAAGIGGQAAAGCQGFVSGPDPFWRAASIDARAHARPATFDPGEVAPGEVGVSFIGHATLRIETPEGVSIATDYAGFAGRGPAPTVVTMNNAHETHFTDFIKPGIEHVLRGWGRPGAPAVHDLRVKDARIRNVTTDLLYGDTRVPDGNSIFIFEIGDLCIGHLGHLHHVPTEAQFAEMGFVDVVFAPVDGVYTMTQAQMIETLKKLRARVVIPMHAFGPSNLERFIAGMADEFEIAYNSEYRVKLSRQTLPASATVLVLPAFRTYRDN